jgi:hypothetical protein
MGVKLGALPETEFGTPDCRGKGGCADDPCKGIDADPNTRFTDDLGAGTGADV